MLERRGSGSRGNGLSGEVLSSTTSQPSVRRNSGAAFDGGAVASVDDNSKRASAYCIDIDCPAHVFTVLGGGVADRANLRELVRADARVESLVIQIEKFVELIRPQDDAVWAKELQGVPLARVVTCRNADAADRVGPPQVVLESRDGRDAERDRRASDAEQSADCRVACPFRGMALYRLPARCRRDRSRCQKPMKTTRRVAACERFADDSADT